MIKVTNCSLKQPLIIKSKIIVYACFSQLAWSQKHEADSIYEVVTRPNQVSDTWENPTNPQHQQAFVNVHDQNKGVTIFNEGLNEYEVLADGTIAVTLIRCVGELGDWGYFATPEAQCQGEYTFKYGLSLHGKPEERFAINKPIVHKFLLLQLLLRVMKVTSTEPCLLDNGRRTNWLDSR